MKAFKLLLLTLFAALGLAAQAQTIEVYKDGQVIDTFSAALVDSVVYKPKTKEFKYYLGETDAIDFSLTDLNKTANDKTDITHIHANQATGDTFTVFIWPTSWGMPTSIIADASGKNYKAAWNINNGDLNVPSGYNYGSLQATAKIGADFTINW